MQPYCCFLSSFRVSFPLLTSSPFLAAFSSLFLLSSLYISSFFSLSSPPLNSFPLPFVCLLASSPPLLSSPYRLAFSPLLSRSILSSPLTSSPPVLSSLCPSSSSLYLLSIALFVPSSPLLLSFPLSVYPLLPDLFSSSPLFVSLSLSLILLSFPLLASPCILSSFCVLFLPVSSPLLLSLSYLLVYLPPLLFFASFPLPLFSLSPSSPPHSSSPSLFLLFSRHLSSPLLSFPSLSSATVTSVIPRLSLLPLCLFYRLAVTEPLRRKCKMASSWIGGVGGFWKHHIERQRTRTT